MLHKIRHYLAVGWHTAHQLHTAHWIVLVLISLLPASVSAAFVGVMGEHSIFLLCVIFILCFAVISFMTLGLLGHPYATTEKGSGVIAQQQEQPAALHFRTVTLEILQEFYRDHTKAEADRLVTPYMGKWISVFGSVNDVTPYPSGGISVWLGAYRCVCDFDPEWRTRVESIRPGKILTIAGTISEIMLSRVWIIVRSSTWSFLHNFL